MSADVIARVKDGPDWLPTQGPKWLTGDLLCCRTTNRRKKSATRVVVQLDDDPAPYDRGKSRRQRAYFGGGMKLRAQRKAGRWQV